MQLLRLFETKSPEINHSEILHDIIDRQTLASVFQPIINIQSGVILGHEGLIRGPEKQIYIHRRIYLNLLKLKIECVIWSWRVLKLDWRPLQSTRAQINYL